MVHPTLSLQVTSSSTGEIYIVNLSRAGDNLTCTCTCPAGGSGTHCKHRLAILAGDKKIVTGGDADLLDHVPLLLEGSDVERALSEVAKWGEAKTEATKKLQVAKKMLAQTMDN